MINNLRTQLAERRMVRQRTRQLEDELASYSSPAERLELDAILSRHSDEEVADLEVLLARPSAVRATHL